MFTHFNALDCVKESLYDETSGGFSACQARMWRAQTLQQDMYKHQQYRCLTRTD